MQICNKCKKEIQETMSFCPHCGAKMGATDTEERMQVAQQHLKTATANMVEAVKEMSGIKNVGLTVAAGLALLGFIIFLFPWISFWGFGESGFGLAFSGGLMILLLLIPASCVASVYFYYYFYKGKTKIELLRKVMLANGAIAILLQAFIYFTGKSKSMGIDIFTGWFYFEFIIWAGMVVAVVLDIVQSKKMSNN